jgi:murein tripeptide amidase MpaA
MAYLNVQEIEWSIQSLANAYPSITELIATPNPTHEGRQTHVLRVGGKSSNSVDGILLLGGVHAREWVPPDALISLAADLLEAYDIGKGLVYGGKKFLAKDIRYILNNLNLFVYPCVNPDGRHHSQSNDFKWRKNRRPHPNGGDCIGVDLNRNFNFLWDHLTKFSLDSKVSASDNPCNKEVYRGPSPASEPETQNIVWLLDSYTKIKWHIDLHSAVPVILHSWGSDQNQTSDPSQNFSNTAFDGIRGRSGDSDIGYGEYIPSKDLKLVKKIGGKINEAVKAVRGVDYPLDQAFGLYPTSGASDDYAFSRHLTDPSKTKVYGFTIECGRDDFQPPWFEAEEVIREVSAGLIEFCLATSS